MDKRWSGVEQSVEKRNTKNGAKIEKGWRKDYQKMKKMCTKSIARV